MSLIVRTHDDILRNIIDNLKNSGINYLPQGSKARSIAASLARELDIAYRFFDSNYDAAFLAGASNEFLEALGVLFNVKRRNAKKAFSSSAEQNITFYASDDQTFGEINSGSDVVVLAGTIFETKPLLPNVDPIQYQLLNDAVLRSSDKVGFAIVEALVEGTASNVGPNTLRIHDFTDYDDNNADSLKVTNRFAVVNGEDKELDSSLRARISIAATALQKGNASALRFAALAVPGVVDVSVLRYFDGIGTVGVFTTGQDNETPPSLLTDVQLSLNDFSSAGEIVTSYAPVKLGVEFVTKVNLSRDITINERTEIEQRLLSAANSFFAQLSIGDDVDIDAFIRLLLSTDRLIVNFGSDPKVAPFDELYLYRFSDATGERIRAKLLNNITELVSENHEIFVIESSIAEPLRFTFDPIT